MENPGERKVLIMLDELDLPDADTCLFIRDLGLTTLDFAAKHRNWLRVTGLHCLYNELTNLPDLGNMEVLFCDHNKLIEIPDCDTLRILDCDYNPLPTLPAFKNIREIMCRNCEMVSLPDFELAERVYCEYNKLPSLPPWKNAFIINCQQNPMKSYPLWPKAVHIGGDLPESFIQLCDSLESYSLDPSDDGNARVARLREIAARSS